MTDGDSGGPVQGVLDLADWEQPTRRPAGPAAAPVLAVAHFEGQLDWLLELARTRRIDLARVSIADLMAAFEEAFTTALAVVEKGPLLLARWGEWLVMATELALLRACLAASVCPLTPARATACRGRRSGACSMPLPASARCCRGWKPRAGRWPPSCRRSQPTRRTATIAAAQSCPQPAWPASNSPVTASQS